MATQSRTNSSSHWTEPLQHTQQATLALLNNLYQDLDSVRSAVENNDFGKAQSQFNGIVRRIKTLNNFVHQCARMDRSVSSYERRLGTSQYGESGLSPQQRRITAESLPDDPRQLEQIVTNATRKLGKAVAA